MGDVLPHETENTVYRYLIAISKLRLGILNEQGEGSSELVPFFQVFLNLFIYLFIFFIEGYRIGGISPYLSQEPWGAGRRPLSGEMWTVASSALDL